MAHGGAAAPPIVSKTGAGLEDGGVALKQLRKRQRNGKKTSRKRRENGGKTSAKRQENGKKQRKNGGKSAEGESGTFWARNDSPNITNCDQNVPFYSVFQSV